MSAIHVYSGADAKTNPVIRHVTPADVAAALREGLEDFWAMPSHLAFLGIIYPICGVLISYMASSANLLQLVFPLISGLALIGPILAIGLYQMSRRREQGLEFSVPHAFDVLRSPSALPLVVLSLALAAIFALWIAAAQAIYAALYGADTPISLDALLLDAFSSTRGLELALVGCGVGFVFAAVTFALSVISFPLLLDRDVGLVKAIQTSFAAVLRNPLTMALWALIVAGLLVLGSLPLLLGLAVVMPVLGHASWRFYRRVIVREPEHENLAEYPLWRVGHTPSYMTRPHSILFPGPTKE